MGVMSGETRSGSRPGSIPRLAPDVRRARPVGARKLAAATMVGSAIEWYDFYVYGTSVVLVLGPLFFPAADGLTSTLLAFSTFAVGFLVRPVGAVVIAHIGDRVGRTRALVLSLVLMGVATVGVGLLPTYAQVGVIAPLLLVLLRLVQGFAVGGEWGGAALLAIEHAPAGRSALYGSMPQYGTPIGLLGSSAAIMAVSLLPRDAFLAWGWRLPFLVSAVLVMVGLWIRLRVTEADGFLEMRRAGAVVRRPLFQVLRRHRRAVAVGTAVTLVCHAAYLVSTFLPSYASTSLGRTDGDALAALIAASLIGIVVLAATGIMVRDRDPRPVAAVGALLMAAWIFPAFALAASGRGGLVLGVTVGLSVLMLQYAVLPAILAEQFPIEVRYTGISLCFQLSAVLGGGLLPLAASALVGKVDHFAPAAILMVVAGLVSAAGAFLCGRAPRVGTVELTTSGSPAPLPQA